jgi:DNA-binding XRE family transcriptional regulator
VEINLNKAKQQLRTQNNRAKTLGVVGQITLQDWLNILMPTEGICPACKVQVGFERLSIDHIRSLKCGGTNERHNIAALCKPCNCRKNGGFKLTVDGKILREKRETLGLTQKELADLFDVSLNTISRWEIGNMAIRGAGAIKLALDRLESIGIRRIQALIKEGN